MTVKELINIVLDSPFYLSMPLHERKYYIRSFISMYMKEEQNERSQKEKKSELSAEGSY